MPRFTQILPIQSPMNDTVDKERLNSSEGTVLNRENLRPDSIGSMFANVPLKGTLAIDFANQFELPSGTNKTVGWCIDYSKETIIWFVWNSNNDHCVYQVDVTKNLATPIWYKEPALNLSDTDLNPSVIDGRVYWNDNVDEPKAFNIDKAIARTYDLFDPGNAPAPEEPRYVTNDYPLQDKVFPYIKQPPRFAPNIIYRSLTNYQGQDINFNNLRKKQWQFKYCYVYEDYQESAYSPTSRLLIPPFDINALGIWEKELTQNNAIQITLNTGNNNVKKIKVAVRDASLLNNGPWFLFAEIDKEADGISNDTNIDEYFLNNTYMTSIDTDRENAYFHNVPIKAKDLILLDNKYVSMSEPTEGYDFTEGEVDYDLEEVEQGVTFNTQAIAMGQALYDDINQAYALFGYRVILTPLAYANSEYKVEFVFAEETFTAGFITGDSVANYPEDVRDSLADQLEGITLGDGRVTNVVVKKTDTDKIDIEIQTTDPNLRSNTSIYFRGKVIVPGESNVYRGLKRGQYHPFGIVYNDKNGRYNVVFGNNRLYATPSYPGGPVYAQTVVRPKITIRHRPPEWATSYRIAYIPYNSYTYQLQVPAVEQIVGTGGNGIPSNKVFLKINQSITRMKEFYPNNLIQAYVWENGDRVKHIAYEDSYELLEEFTRIYELNGESIIETGYLCDFEFPTILGKVLGLEVYRPNRTPQDKAYYEIGHEFEILNPGTAQRSHAGQQNQSSDLATPSVSTLDFGDIYFRERLSGDIDAPVITAECSDVSDYYDSTGISIGRAVARIELKQSVLGRITRSEQYVEDTFLNRLNMFLPGSEFYDVSEQDGKITRILQKGDVLKVLQEHKETSVYIGKNYAKDGSGNDIILVSDKTFGSFNKYDAYNGSKYPHSVVASEDYVYFLDTFTGDLMRSATNGTMSLPRQYHMLKTFEEKCRAFREYQGTKDVLLAVEPNQDTVYTTFIMGNTIETIAFCENDLVKGFVFRVDFSNGPIMPEHFAWFGDFMYSWANGRMYIHGMGDDNSFYGSQRKTSVLEVIGNEAVAEQKTFETISIDSDGNYSLEFEVEADSNFPFGQFTQIFPDMLKKREGVLTSAIPKNIRDLKGNELLQRLYSGNDMMGHAVTIKLSSSDLSILREIKLLMINQK